MKDIKPKPHIPPRWATMLLQWVCPAYLANEMEGDLNELFNQRVSAVGVRRAKWRYIKDILSLIRPLLMKSEPEKYPNPNHIDMLRNYIKISFRNLSKSRTYSTINIIGLSVGMTTAILIGFWRFL